MAKRRRREAPDDPVGEAIVGAAAHLFPPLVLLSLLNKLAYERDYKILGDPKSARDQKRAAQERIDRSVSRGRTAR